MNLLDKWMLTGRVLSRADSNMLHTEYLAETRRARAAVTHATSLWQVVFNGSVANIQIE
jgi:hypothetical protein